MRQVMAVLMVAIPTAVFGADDAPLTVIIREATIYDGTGGEAFRGDVAISGAKIAAIGKVEAAGDAEIIDGTGLCVAPGFIDLHNHSDTSILADASRANLNYLRQGCTTIVTGNCGAGAVDVEEYFATIERQGAGTHVAHLIPQGAVRSSVMGSVSRPPTADEIKRMKALFDKGMRDGAFGVSTGLIYVPGTFSSTDELVELTKVVAQHGGMYASHIRDEGKPVLKSIDEAIAIGRRAGCRVHVSHLKASGKAAWGLGNDICNLIAGERAKGLAVTADQYPYRASSTSLEATIVPTWAREGGEKKLIARLSDAETSTRLLNEIAKDIESHDGGESIQIAHYKANPKWDGKRLSQIAAEMGMTPLEAATEIIRKGGASVVNFSMSDEDVRLIAGRDFVATASDGSARALSSDKPHPRSYGTFTRKIGEFAYRRGWLSVSQAVRSSSGLPADILGLKDRGYIKPGMAADVVVFDLEKLRDAATFEEPHQYSVGFKRVFVAGTAAVIDDKPTGALAGKPIRYYSPLVANAGAAPAKGSTLQIRVVEPKQGGRAPRKPE